MRKQIESILENLPDVDVQEVGTLWQIRIGSHAGAREDGIGLARDMLAMHKARERAMAEPVPVEIPDFLLEPEVAEVIEEPEPAPIDVAPSDPAPAEPAPTEVVPEGLLDLVRENEAYGDTQTRLWSLYLELNGKLMLGLATEEDARLHTRLHGHLAWISKGAAEVV
jgi:hypothetical protein